MPTAFPPALRLLVAAACLAAPSLAAAELSLPAVFGDHMVLQRDMATPVFGQADADVEVTVTFGDQTKAATADAEGRFSVKLDAMKASAEPQTLTVKAGDEEKSFSDVLVGEVWVCSGQSNMEWAVSQSTEAEIEILTANRPNLRLIEMARVTADQPQDDVVPEMPWTPATPDSVKNFSAVGYYFGRTLHDALQVPVGLIDTTWGGTRAEAWTPPEAAAANDAFRPLFEGWAQRQDRYDPETAKQLHAKAMQLWEQKMATFRQKRQEGSLPPGAQQPRRPQLQADPNTDRHNVSRLWNAMVAGMVPYAIRGSIWYQGESNSGRAKQYRPVITTMIEGWRDAWGQGDFPFYQVQLANYLEPTDEPGESTWAELREAQDDATEDLPNVDKVTITDIGAAKDIHPKDKQNVAKRLARLALTDVYGLTLSRTGPQFDGVEFADGEARVRFRDLGEGGYKGLETYYRQPLRGFTIAGEDKQFRNVTDARIEGDTVILRHPQVSSPASVRYNWADNPNGTLQNRAGLPAEPFRTDDWPGLTDNVVAP